VRAFGDIMYISPYSKIISLSCERHYSPILVPGSLTIILPVAAYSFPRIKDIANRLSRRKGSSSCASTWCICMYCVTENPIASQPSLVRALARPLQMCFRSQNLGGEVTHNNFTWMEPRYASLASLDKEISACIKHRRPTTMRSGAGPRGSLVTRLYEMVQQSEQ
jgi:hypothetical protein